MSLLLRSFLFFSLVFFLGSCSLSKSASNLTSKILLGGSPVIEQESDIEVAESSGLAMIKTLEVFHHQNPENENYLLLLSKSYGTYSFGFLENRIIQFQSKDESRSNAYLERTKLFYMRGKDFGLALIQKRNQKIRKAIDQGLGVLREALKGADRDDVPALFWTAFSWGGYINYTKDSVRSVSDLAIVEAIMARVLELDPHFFYDGPNLFYGVYFASRPPMLGGNPEQAAKHFEMAAKATGGKLLMPYLLDAQYRAVQINDKALFDDLLSKVDAGSLDALPEQRLANALAKERAKFLREREKDLF